jgi:tRNA(Ile)-lysidine synthase TilS/MesJ
VIVMFAVARKRRMLLLANCREDQQETVVHRFGNGNNINGLAGYSSLGFHSDGVTLMRPLLCTSKVRVRLLDAPTAACRSIPMLVG